MQPHDVEPTVPHVPEVTGPAAPSTTPGHPAIQTWLPALLAALLAGVLAWVVGERTFEYAQPPESISAASYDFIALNREMERTSGINGALTFGAMGGLLGLALGLAGGLTRRSAGGAVLGALAGVILGAAAGALPSFGIMPWQWRHRNDDPSSTQLLIPLLTHAGLWCAEGIAAGVAYAVGRGDTRPARLLQAALGGLIGAAIGTVAFELVGALAFPTARTAYPFSETSVSRLFARLCVAVFVAVGVVLALDTPRSRGKAVARNPHPLDQGPAVA